MNDIVKSPLCILLLSGPIAVGKTSVANQLVKQQCFERVRSGAFLQCKAGELGIATNRACLQSLGDELDLKTDYRWLVDEVALPAIENNPNQKRWLIDAVRKKKQVENFRLSFCAGIIHVHLLAGEKTLKERYESRIVAGEEYFGDVSYEQAIQHPNEVSSRGMRDIADCVIDVECMSTTQIIKEISDRLIK